MRRASRGMGLGCRDQAEYSSRGANILWAWGLPTHRGLLVPAELGAEQNEEGGPLAPGAAVVLHNHLRRVSRNQKVLVFLCETFPSLSSHILLLRRIPPVLRQQSIHTHFSIYLQVLLEIIHIPLPLYQTLVFINGRSCIIHPWLPRT